MNAAKPHTRHHPDRISIPNTLALLPKMVVRQRRTARELLAEKTVYPLLVVVVGVAILESLLFLIS